MDSLDTGVAMCFSRRNTGVLVDIEQERGNINLVPAFYRLDSASTKAAVKSNATTGYFAPVAA